MSPVAPIPATHAPDHAPPVQQADLAEGEDTDAAVTAGRAAAKKLDQAASKGVIHKNQAANRKSAIAKKAASL